MSQRFVKHNRNSICEIKAPNVRIEHGYLEAMRPIRLQEILRQTPRFSPKNKAIVVAKRPIGVWPFSLCGKVKETACWQGLVEIIEIWMSMQDYFWPIIEACSAHCSIVQTKPGGADNVKWSSGGSAESCDVAGVLRYLGLDESNINHECSSEIEINPWKEKGTTSFA